jgi:hypothetical protein
MPSPDESTLFGLDELKAKARDAHIVALELVKETEQMVRETKELCERVRKEARRRRPRLP